MNLERDEAAILLACVCGFLGGCASGFAMAKSRIRGFLGLAASSWFGAAVWYFYQVDTQALTRLGGLSPGMLAGTLMYVFLAVALAFVLGTLGCSLTWLILHLTALCRKRGR